MKWAQSIVECLVMSNPSQREVSAVVKLLSRQSITNQDAAWLLHIVATNPMMKLDSLDIEEFEEWLNAHCNRNIRYETSK